MDLLLPLSTLHHISEDHLLSTQSSMTKNSSPAKRVRSLKRLMTFIFRKPNQAKYSNLGIKHLALISILPPNKMLSFYLNTSMSIPPASRNLSISKMVSISILPPPEPYSNSHLPVLQNQHRQPALDIKDYPQHELDDLDPDRERKRQENVKTTLRMIDDALSYSK